ncbi:hypothetical protein D1814_07015 [Alteromonas sp. BL110]|uniref:hypothetical protein n=1 Tax=Alteromonas sp. BL110 TaxID=1714845 RepID=UPI000E5322A1|nr:hypothetical protein [Alteromonas sp. BL110]AXT38440.1 hypothetical protein D1814_07015 [Alteromonas sp. BL110]RKM83816.1 hypothetical protein D7031_01915 [Alteromonas sp. BL110]
MINPRKYGLHAIKTAALSLALAASFQVAAQNDKERVESIEVFGEKTTPQLKKAFDKQRFEFLELYNSINETAKFDVICKYEKPIGSQIARKSCEPRFVKDFRAMKIRTSSTGVGIDLNRLPSDDDIRFLTKDTREEAFEHVAALVATHPDLFDSFSKLDALHQRIEQRKEDN